MVGRTLTYAFAMEAVARATAASAWEIDSLIVFGKWANPAKKMPSVAICLANLIKAGLPVEDLASLLDRYPEIQS